MYSLASGDVDNLFSVDSSTGDIILVDTLDFETASVNPYDLVIRAVDQDPTTKRTGSTTVRLTVVDQNDNTPTCTSMLQTFQLPELTQTSSTVTLLNIGTTCSDADSGVNGQLGYNIYSVNGAVGTSAPFSIDASGATRLASPVDYELVPAYIVKVRVYDAGTPARTATVTVEVEVTNNNDNIPVFTSTPYSANVIETTSVGSTVFTVTASDDDEADTITFTINPPMNEFAIDPSNGKIILTEALDFDTAPTVYEIIVVATDNGLVPGPSSSSATVTIRVTDFNDGTPEFHPAVYAASLSENVANGYTVTTLTITDIDSTAFTYNIVSGNNLNVFGVSGTGLNGVITVVDRTNLDYETTIDFSLVIRVTDGSNTASATIEITVLPYNEHSPVFAGGLNAATATIAENAAIGASVYDVDATDTDDGRDGVIVYSIVSGSGGKFAVNPSTGLVTVAGTLDVESTPTYTLVVAATDRGTSPGKYLNACVLFILCYLREASSCK